MPDPITWYALGRTVDDVESILEAVDTKILTHNLDPSAHGQTNEAVYEHRAAALIDHVSYSIYNIKTAPAARIFKAIVDTGGVGDFSTIQQAIEWANLYGGGVVYIRAGSYIQTDDIVLYSNIELQGEDDDTTIIDFNHQANGVIIAGTVGTHKRNIRLKKLNIDGVWGEEVATAIRYADDILIEDVKYTECFDTGVGAGFEIDIGTGSNRVNIKRTRHINSYRAVGISAGAEINIEDLYATGGRNNMIQITGGDQIKIDGINVKDGDAANNGDAVIYADTGSENLKITNNKMVNAKTAAISLYNYNYATIIGNSGRDDGTGILGIGLTDCDKCTVLGNIMEGYVYDGIQADTNADKNIITGNVCDGNGRYGVNIVAGTCDKNIVVANQLSGNTSGGLNDAGTGTVNANNITA